jgi:hypothetical protein
MLRGSKRNRNCLRLYAEELIKQAGALAQLSSPIPSDPFVNNSEIWAKALILPLLYTAG